MPLLDHFHSPLKEERHWEGMHSAWANAIVTLLNGSVLPAHYFAEPNVKLGVEAEVDVATYGDTENVQARVNGGVATALYSPPKPAVRFAVDFSELDTFEIQVREEGGLKLVAAIELVSPANKDRPSHRQAFVDKCCALLQDGVSLAIVDVVTERSGNLHTELVEKLAPAESVELTEDDALYAIAYRVHPKNRVEAWPERLAIGKALPTLPLWLSEILAVPVDLEASYVAACKALRIRTS